MSQAPLYPCVDDSDPGWKGGRGPQCDGAVGVEVMCRVELSKPSLPGSTALRQPEPGTATLSDAALRAFASLGF